MNMSDDIDERLGKRLRRRRRLLGLTQKQVGVAIGVRFQQIQKYECGANKMSAARLWALAEALEVPGAYFYEDLTSAIAPEAHTVHERATKETTDLIPAYYRLPERPRRRLLDLAVALQGGPGPDVA